MSIEQLDDTGAQWDTYHVSLVACAEKMNDLLRLHGDMMSTLLGAAVIWPHDNPPSGVNLTQHNGQWLLTVSDVMQAVLGNEEMLLSPIIGSNGALESFTVARMYPEQPPVSTDIFGAAVQEAVSDVAEKE